MSVRTKASIFFLALLIVLVSTQTMKVGFVKITNYTTNTKPNVIKVALVGDWTALALYTYAGVALKYINEIQTKILPNHMLEVYEWNTATQVSSALVGAISAITDFNAKAILAGAYTNENTAIALASSYFMTPHITPVASGVELSNKVTYPSFMRVVGSDSGQCVAIIQFMLRNGWKRFTVVYDDSAFGVSGKDTLLALGKEYNMTMNAVAVPSVGAAGAADYRPQVQQVIDADARIIVAYLNPWPGFWWAKACYQLGFYGPEIAHIVSQSISLSVHNTVYFARDPLFYNATQAVYIPSIGITPEPIGSGELYDAYRAYWITVNRTAWPGNIAGIPQAYTSYALFGFDAVYTVALALHNMIERGIDVNTVANEKILYEMRNLTFNGTSGFVSFDSNGDRIGNFGIRLMTKAAPEIIEMFSAATGKFTRWNYNINYTYANGLQTPPYDSPFFCPCVHGTCEGRNPTCYCEAGWSGETCNIMEKQGSEKDSTPLIAGIVAPVAFAAIAGAIISYYIYNKKRKQFVKEMVDKQRSDVPRSDIQLGKRIGRGASGEVFTAQFRGTEVAVKRLIAKSVSRSIIQEFQLESAMMCSLRHPNVVLFMGSCYDLDSQEMLLVMEFMSRGSLYNVLHDPNIALPFELQLHMAYQTAQGINFLHQSSPPIIHCDIKSHNVLLDDKWNARISDFGITRLVKLANGSEGAKDSNSNSSVGTIFWTAPEVLESHPFTEMSDCYAFGMVLWEIFHRQDPYAGKDPVVAALEVVRSGLRPVIAPNVQAEIRELIEQCWHSDPARRPNFQEIVQKLRQLTIKHPIYNYGASNNRTDPPTGLVYYVATEVHGAYELWDEHPEQMKEAMILHNKLLRSNLQQYSGYEVLYGDHGFEASFGSLEDAMNWSISVQASLMHVQWPAALLSHPRAANKSSLGTTNWNGLRVRIAINKGLPQCERDSVTLHMSYHGPVVEKTRSILKFSPAGFITVASAVHHETKERRPNFIESVDGQEYSRVTDSKTQKSDNTFVYALSSLNRDVPAPTKQNSNRGGAVLTHEDSLPHSVVVNVSVSEVQDYQDDVQEKRVTIPTWVIKWDNLELKELVGKGRVGEVFRAFWGNKEVAVKVLFNQKFSEEDMFTFLVLASHASKMRHANVVPFYGVVVASPNISIVTEFKHKGSLNDVLSHGSFASTLHAKVKIATDIANGMRYIRRQPGFVGIHRDLKTPNILVGASGDIKVADFGLAALYDVTRTLTSIGLVTWTAPELMSGEVSVDDTENFYADVYAFGIILWEIFTHQRPYEKMHPIKLVSKVFDGYRPEIPIDCPAPYKALMAKCWDGNARSRPSWDEVISMLEAMDR